MKLRQFFFPNRGDFQQKKGGLRAHAEGNLKGTKLPKKYEIAQNFDAKLPKKH